MNTELTAEPLLFDFRFGPFEGLGLGVRGFHEAVDGLVELPDLGETSAAQGLPEKDLNQISTWFIHEAWVGVK